MAGLALKTRVFAAVKATNLDKRYNKSSDLNIFTATHVGHIKGILLLSSVKQIWYSMSHFYLFGPLFLCFADIHYAIMLLFFKGASLERRKPRSEIFPCAVRSYPPSHLTVLSLCRWNILMDYCYTTPSGNPNDELRYDLFFR